LPYLYVRAGRSQIPFHPRYGCIPSRRKKKRKKKNRVFLSPLYARFSYNKYLLRVRVLRRRKKAGKKGKGGVGFSLFCRLSALCRESSNGARRGRGDLCVCRLAPSGGKNQCGRRTPALLSSAKSCQKRSECSPDH